MKARGRERHLQGRDRGPREPGPRLGGVLGPEQACWRGRQPRGGPDRWLRAPLHLLAHRFRRLRGAGATGPADRLAAG